MDSAKRTTAIIAIVITVLLGSLFSVVYFDDHAWGTWGDDSAGYIFLAGLLYQGEPLVYNDELATAGLEYFEDEKLARWLTPTHHQFINPRGTIASKYPIGASLVMVAAARILGTDNAFYFVTPALAVANIILVYILGLLLFSHSRHRHIIGTLAAVFMGVANLYYNYAIAQPMREIPSMFFMLLAVVFTLLAVQFSPLTRSIQKRRWALLWAVVAGLSFGMALNIRETTAVILPGLVVYVVWSLWQKRSTFKKNLQNIFPYVVAFVVAVCFAVLPTIFNSIAISHEKEAFKANDTNSALLSNINHVQSLSVTNIFSSEGKFSPDSGSLPHYIDVLSNSSPVPYFLLLVLLGVFYMWRTSKESRKKGALLVLWALGVLGIFSMWINPYARYILPMYPAIMLLGAYGITALLEDLLPKILKRKYVHVIAGILVVATFIVGYVPVAQKVQLQLQEDVYLFKAISQNDLEQLRSMARTIESESTKEPVLLFSGEWQYGTSETLQAHTGLKTVRFPLEQRFDFNTQKVYAFIDSELVANRDLYVWIDETASDEAFTWLERYNTELMQEYDYTFQDRVQLYRVISVNENNTQQENS